jgi:hypothetical protein
MQKTSVFSDFYCLPNKLALMGLRPGQSSAVPTGLDFEMAVLRQTLKPGCLLGFNGSDTKHECGDFLNLRGECSNWLDLHLGPFNS